MNEEQIINLLQMLIKKVDDNDNRVDELEKSIYTQILQPISELAQENDYKDWKDKYGYPLEDYAETMKSVEGPDYDLTRDAYNKAVEHEVKEDEMDDYVDGIVDELENQLSTLRDKLGLKQSDELTVTDNGNGETEVQVNGETVDPEEEKIEEENKPVPTEEEEIAEFENELNNYDKGEIK